jgi:cyclohexadienyl dehydratase
VSRTAVLLWAALLGAATAFQSPPRPPASAEDSLARIRRAGVLRVGTTGDYEPFSFLDSRGRLRGIDVEAASRLAQAVGPNVRVRFVRTTWPTMTADLLAGDFDVAMSGVSRNRERAEVGSLSRTYLTDAKVALIRAADRGKYRTLADLDRAGVLVVVNPGGTNSQFVAANVKRAGVVVVRDNPAIPRLVAEGKGDVMFTDGVEARISARRDPRLFVALTDPPLMPVEKVYYLSRGQAELLRVVDAWVGRMQADGSYARLWAKYVGE